MDYTLLSTGVDPDICGVGSKWSWGLYYESGIG